MPSKAVGRARWTSPAAAQTWREQILVFVYAIVAPYRLRGTWGPPADPLAIFAETGTRPDGIKVSTRAAPDATISATRDTPLAVAGRQLMVHVTGVTCDPDALLAVGFAGLYDAHPWLSFAPLTLTLADGPLVHLLQCPEHGRWAVAPVVAAEGGQQGKARATIILREAEDDPGLKPEDSRRRRSPRPGQHRGAH